MQVQAHNCNNILKEPLSWFVFVMFFTSSCVGETEGFLEYSGLVLQEQMGMAGVGRKYPNAVDCLGTVNPNRRKGRKQTSHQQL